MDSFGSDFSSGASSGKMDTGTIMEQVKVQIAVANAQELLQVSDFTLTLKMLNAVLNYPYINTPTNNFIVLPTIYK